MRQIKGTELMGRSLSAARYVPSFDNSADSYIYVSGVNYAMMGTAPGTFDWG